MNDPTHREAWFFLNICLPKQAALMELRISQKLQPITASQDHYKNPAHEASSQMTVWMAWEGLCCLLQGVRLGKNLGKHSVKNRVKGTEHAVVEHFAQTAMYLYKHGDKQITNTCLLRLFTGTLPLEPTKNDNQQFYWWQLGVQRQCSYTQIKGGGICLHRYECCSLQPSFPLFLIPFAICTSFQVLWPAYAQGRLVGRGLQSHIL